MTTPTFEAFVKAFEDNEVFSIRPNGDIVFPSAIIDFDLTNDIRKAYDALFPSAAENDTTNEHDGLVEFDLRLLNRLNDDIRNAAEQKKHYLERAANVGKSLPPELVAAAVEFSNNFKPGSIVVGVSEAIDGATQEELTESANGWIPIYQSIKRVQAFKIKSILLVEGGYALIPEDQESLSFKEDQFAVVDKAYFDKHQPKTGGYYVLYEDGYQSWSPAESFEAGNICAKNCEVTISADGNSVRLNRDYGSLIYDKKFTHWELRTLCPSNVDEKEAS